MNSNQQTTSHFYHKAVAGLNELVLSDRDLWYSQIVNLPSKEQITYTVIVLNEQVLNGGFHQYFFNPYGMFAYMTIENLRIIEAFDVADILERAVSTVNEEELSNDDYRDNIFNRKFSKIVDFDDDLFSALSHLDDEYSEVNENLEELLVNYLRK
jgi:hypothetical protein